MNKNQNCVTSAITSPRLLSLTLGLAMVSCGTHAFAAATYSMTDFAKVGTGNFVPIAVKANGQILGYASTLSPIDNVRVNTPQIYDTKTGTFTSINTLVNGDTFASAVAINASGQAIGQVLPANSTTGVSPNVFVRNANGTVIDLGMSPGSTIWRAGIGAGINDAGKIFGNKSGTFWCDWRTFVGNVNGGGLQSLGSLGGGAYDMTWASAMNASGQIVGRSSTKGSCSVYDTYHAFITTSAGLKDLHAPGMPVLRPGTGGSTARAINDYGFVAGQYPFAFGVSTRSFPGGIPIMHAVIWDTVAGTYTDLGRPHMSSTLISINATGQAVGSESAFTKTGYNFNSHAVIGDIATGRLTNLNSLVTGMPTGRTFTSAYNISDAGQILASATDAVGTSHYALLTPSNNSPLAPSNLNSPAITRNKIVLNWTDNADNERNFQIERCTGLNCTSFTRIATIGANRNTYTNSSLYRNTYYSYRVRAANAVGKSGYTNTLNVKTLP